MLATLGLFCCWDWSDSEQSHVDFQWNCFTQLFHDFLWTYFLQHQHPPRIFCISQVSPQVRCRTLNTRLDRSFGHTWTPPTTHPSENLSTATCVLWDEWVEGGESGCLKSCCRLQVSVRQQKEEEAEQWTSESSSLICGSVSASLWVLKPKPEGWEDVPSRGALLKLSPSVWIQWIPESDMFS